MIRDEELIGLNKVETWNTHEALSHGTSLITWNMGKEGAHQKFGVRKAMELLINRQKMIRELGEDRMYPSRGFRPTQQTPFLEEEMDIEEGRRLLLESGYAGEEIVICSKGSLLADADWIQKRCSEFGINIRIRRETTLSVRTPDLLSEVDGILFCVVFAVEEVCEIENYEQAGNFLREHLHPEVREWAMAQVSSTLASDSAQRRRTLLNGIEERLREQSHVLFLTHRKQNAYVHETVKGVGLNQLGWMDFKNIWLENEAASFNVPEDETTMISRS
jgi:MarR-like DNA-binding transcriptional regulator SgrR of sgrS sRNA